MILHNYGSESFRSIARFVIAFSVKVEGEAVELCREREKLVERIDIILRHLCFAPHQLQVCERGAHGEDNADERIVGAL